MIESNQRFSMIIYIDHFVAISIFKQTILNNTSINKFNFRLIRIFQYFSLFNFEFKYKIDKSNTMLDILSRLPQTINIIIAFSDRVEKALDVLYGCTNN